MSNNGPYAPRYCERAGCEIRYTPTSTRQRFCTPRCTQLAYAARSGQHGRMLDRGTAGAVAELLASADLFKRGYEVFRALSSQASCDLLALADGRTLRIEVRTGWRNAVTGHVSYPRNGTTTKRRPESALDHYAVVVDGQVTYVPELA